MFYFIFQQEQYMQLERNAPVTNDTADVDYDYDPPMFQQDVSHIVNS